MTSKKKSKKSAPRKPSLLKPGEVPVLKVVSGKGLAYNNFEWPLKAGARVTAPDWKKTKKCGRGLHGWLYGEGQSTAATLLDTAAGIDKCKWLVLAVSKRSIIELDGKVKFPSCRILYAGSRQGATRLMQKLAPGKAVIGSVVKSGAYSAALVGDHGEAVVGNFGVAVAGVSGRASSGNQGSSYAGANGSATSGTMGRAVVGENGTARVGDDGSAVVMGCGGLAVAGYSGRATVGGGGTARVGNFGIASAGKYGVVCGDSGSTVTIISPDTAMPVSMVLHSGDILCCKDLVLDRAGNFVLKPIDY